jgi:hypothetical protein
MTLIHFGCYKGGNNMIIRGAPKNKNNFILVDSETAKILHSNGFIPMYIDENGVYYKKNKEILEFMERRIKN